MSIEKELVKINYTATNLPHSVRNFRQQVYRDENGIYAMPGVDPANNIIGTGETVEKALQEWGQAYHKQISDQG